MKPASKIISFTFFLIFSNFVSSFAHIPLEELRILKIENKKEKTTSYAICRLKKIGNNRLIIKWFDTGDEEGNGKEEGVQPFSFPKLEQDFKKFINQIHLYGVTESNPFIQEIIRLFNEEPTQHAPEILFLFLRTFEWFEPYYDSINTSQYDSSLSAVFEYYLKNFENCLSMLPFQQHFAKNIIFIQKKIDEVLPCITISVIKKEIEKIKNQTSLNLLKMKQSYPFYIYDNLFSLFELHVYAREYLSEEEIQSCTTIEKLITAKNEKLVLESQEKKSNSSLWTWKNHPNFYLKLFKGIYANIKGIIDIKDEVQFSKTLATNILVDAFTKKLIDFSNIVSIIKDQYTAKKL